LVMNIIIIIIITIIIIDNYDDNVDSDDGGARSIIRLDQESIKQGLRWTTQWKNNSYSVIS